VNPLLLPSHFRAIWVLAACLTVASAARADVNEDRKAVAQRINAEITSHSFKKVYVADFLDTVSGRIDKGCFFASVFSANLSDGKPSFTVINRIEGQRLLTKAQFLSDDLQKAESPTKAGAATGADALVMGTFQQTVSNIVLEISLREASSGKEIFHAQYQEKASDEFEALFPAALDPTGTIYLFPDLDGIGHANCVNCPRTTAAASQAGQPAAATQLISAVFTADGKLDQARIVRSADPTADQAALESLKNWKAEPAKDTSGAAVSVRQPVKGGESSGVPTTYPRAATNGISSPQCIYCPSPEYSEEARKAKLDGTVAMDIIVLADGTVKDPVIVNRPGHGFEAKAIEAVSRWKFKPATDKEGKPVACRVKVEVTFRTYKQ
jgi:TonB family protein